MAALSINILKRHATDDSVQKVITSQHAQRLQEAYDRAYQIKYDLNGEDFETVANMFSPQVVTIAPGARPHPHPIPALLQTYAYEESYHFSKNFRNCIDIGGTPLRTPNGHHLCAKVGDCLRTGARYINASLMNNNGKHKAFVAHALYGHKQICGEGAEYCTVMGEYAYMINVYDVPIETIPLIMHQHKTLVLDVWMFLPNCLHDYRLKNDETFYKCHYEPTSEAGGMTFGYLNQRVTNDKIRFSLNDQCMMYEHKYSTWQKYMHTTSICAGDHSVFVEHIGRKLHTFQRIRFTRHESIDNRIHYRRLDLPGSAGLTLVPDVRTYFKQGCYDNMYRYHFLVETKFVTEAYKYWNRQPDHGFSASNFYSYMDGKSAAVYYQAGSVNTFVYKGVDQQGPEYTELLTSLYIIGMVKREKQTKLIGQFIVYAKREQGTLTDRLVHLLRRGYFETKERVWKTIKSEDNFDYETRIKSVDETYIKNLTTKILENPIVGGCIELTYGYGKRTYDRITATNHASITMYTGDKSEQENEEKFELVQFDEAHECNLKVIYNPVGDGACGRHALEYFMGKLDDNHTWHNDEELAKLAASKGWSLIAHTGDTVVSHCYSRYAPIARIALRGNHWLAVQCDCSTYDYYVGDYADLPINKNDTYVNCANNNCTDGAGQAAAFNKLFPGYKETIELPIGSAVVLPYHECTLVVAVANNQMANKDRGMSKERYNIIADVISNNATGTVYMPLLGTALFGCDLCCFKEFLNKVKHENLTLCFYNDKQRQNFDITQKCTHAGYKVVVNATQPKFVKGIYNPVNYDKLNPAQDGHHMKLKFSEIEKFCIDQGVTRIIDIASAPGDFAIYKDKKIPYLAMHYTGPDSFRKRMNYRTLDWSKISQLIAHLNTLAIDRNTCILWDCPTHYNIELHAEMLNVVRSHDIKYLTKTMSYTEIPTGDYKNINTIFFRNDGSNTLSSEVFMFCHRVHNTIETTVDVAAVAMQIDRYELEKQDTHVCTCNKVIKLRDSMRFNVLKVQHDTFKMYMSDDVVVKNYVEVSDAIKSIDLVGQYEIGTINGVAGSRKTRDALKDTCSKCAIVIAPYRRIVEDINRTTAGSAITYIKAIKLLQERKFKYVYVDECYSVNAMFIALYAKLQPDARIIGLGDIYQIPCCDFESCAPVIEVDIMDYKWESYRIIPAVAMILSEYCAKITTNNSVGDSKILSVTTLPLDKVTKSTKNSYAVLCYTQEMKAELQAALPDVTVHTVAESQGMTLKKVILMCDDYHVIWKNVGAYVYVALTRTCESLILLSKDDVVNAMLDTMSKWFAVCPFKTYAKQADITPPSSILATIKPMVMNSLTNKEVRFVNHANTIETIRDNNYTFIDTNNTIDKRQNEEISTLVINGDHTTVDLTSNTAVERAMDFAQVIASADVTTDFITVKDRDTMEPMRVYTKEKQDIGSVEDVLRKVFIPSNEQFGTVSVSYVTNLLRENKSKDRMMIDARAINTKDVQIQGSRMGNTQFVLQQCGKSSMATMDCILERYMALPNQQKASAANLYMEGLSKWVHKDFFKPRTKDNSDLYQSTLHYLTNLQQKISLKGQRAKWIDNAYRHLDISTRETVVKLAQKEYNQFDIAPSGEILKAHKAKYVGQYVTSYDGGRIKNDRVDYITVARSNPYKQKEITIAFDDKSYKALKFNERKIIEAPDKTLLDKFIVAINGKTELAKDEHIKNITLAQYDIFALADSHINESMSAHLETTIDALYDKDLTYEKIDTIIKSTNQKLDQLLLRDVNDDSQSLKAFRELTMEWYEKSQSMISFHLKNQPKEVRKDGYDTTNKVGQGVSAWSKMLNCILASIENAFEKDVKRYINSNVLLALDKSDADLSRWFIPYRKLYNDKGVMKTDADHTQFDCTQGYGLALLQSIVYERMGFPKRTVEWLMAMRAQYQATALDTANNARISFNFKWQMTSGALYTLWWNTVANMAITGVCYDFGTVHLAAFKGDDVHIVSTKCIERKVGSTALTKMLGHKIKIQHPVISEFLANIVTPHGFFPDVVRRASRVVSRIYTHPEDWEEICISIADSLSVIDNNTVHLGAQIAAYHYQERGYNISETEVLCLLNFLKSCTHDRNMRPRFQQKFIVEFLNVVN